MKKTWIAGLLAAVMVLSLTACGGGSDSKPAETTAAAAQTEAAETKEEETEKAETPAEKAETEEEKKEEKADDAKSKIDPAVAADAGSMRSMNMKQTATKSITARW